ncbi:MAG: isochorismatase family protein [Vicinamibacterales bacterium]|jgi:nicotinamidase/pyrazinamidase|nr:nicotinamidase [Acidobacteriota bacterium]MDP6373433.1 isochorismatase family protein [Vicinamibacterales bacterium]MDP6608537.1 isochorismatase family protein [Vicinamibacterales bacterium]HAK55625.1 nicotinamidase [Acidobacteriota bacterium]|tara:strand:+ start:125 stop:709 length:585 start_codon:yes stop_codon:yes gene_type:complete
MEPAALLVVDVQKDFCTGGTLAVPRGDRVVAVLNRLVGSFDRRGALVLASRDWHPAETAHFRDAGGAWPPHCIAGSDGAAFHDDLNLPEGTVVVSKGIGPTEDGYSAFDGRTDAGLPLLEALQQRQVIRLYVGGLATDYCVKHSVLDALGHGFEVTVLIDAIAAGDLSPGDGAAALEAMAAAGARLTRSDAIEV